MTLDPTERWHDEVPGTRWFRADLHLHTIDDPNVELPPGIAGNQDAPPCCALMPAVFSTPRSSKVSKPLA